MTKFLLHCHMLLFLLGAIAVDAQPRDQRDTVLFVCQYGSVKSVMAAALFEQAARKRGLALRAVSRGLTPDKQVPARIVAALRDDGVDVADFRPQLVTEEDASNAVRVVVIGIEPSSVTKNRSVVVWNDVPDSTNYPAARSSIERHIESMLDDLHPGPIAISP